MLIEKVINICAQDNVLFDCAKLCRDAGYDEFDPDTFCRTVGIVESVKKEKETN